jgi:hypothetical protein
MRHHWWHHAASGDYFAVATNEGQVVSAWIQVSRYEWSPLDDFIPLEQAASRGEIHRNPYGFTDELGPSRGPVQ